MIKKGGENEEKSAQKSMKKLITEAGVILFDMGGSNLDDRWTAGERPVTDRPSRGGRGGKGEYFQRYFSLKIDPLNIYKWLRNVIAWVKWPKMYTFQANICFLLLASRYLDQKMLVCLKKLGEHDERKHITTKEVAKKVERAGIYTPDPPRGSADCKQKCKKL